MEMLSPSKRSPPQPLHRSMRIFHCSKPDSFFNTYVAFAFTASTDSKRVPFNADFIFGNEKKSHGDLVLRQKHLDRQCVVCRRVVMVKNPWAVLPHFKLKCSCKICRTLSLSMLANSATARMLRQRFFRIISPTFPMLASVFDVQGRPGRGSS
jgi:hypothetical protein